ncbi:hypothetical protein MHK_006468, partial [Candidatus Magnetomorum sp. HK-1]
NRKQMSIIKVVLETIQQLVKDVADNDLMRIIQQIEMIMQYA